ncbi:hypothetical protein TSUD_169410 [Trifolium subterraneum]|nr:hypothetical protein TSUD_169410 [Trifolium subterraneum]
MVLAKEGGEHDVEVYCESFSLHVVTTFIILSFLAATIHMGSVGELEDSKTLWFFEGGAKYVDSNVVVLILNIGEQGSSSGKIIRSHLKS